jgi:hypothetical protein
MYGRAFTKEEDDFLRANYLTIPARRMAAMLGRREGTARQRMKLIGIVVPKEIIEQFRQRSYYKKGQTPFNKGKKGSEYLSEEALAAMSNTQFRKGNLPHNTKEDGVITIRYDHADTRNGIAYKYIRIALAKWMPLHVYNWEQKYGKVKKGYCLWCKNGDTLNCEPDNWELITRAENIKRNSIHNYPKEIALAVQLRGALNRQINKHKKKIHNEK